MNSVEKNKNKSEGQKRRWSHPIKRRDLLEKLLVGRADIIGPLGAQILKILKEKGWLFFREINKLSGLNRNSCSNAILRLYKRGLVKRKKAYNLDGRNVYIEYYKYAITKEGSRILDDPTNIINVSQLPSPAKNKPSTHIGKIQMKLLEVIEKNGPLFFGRIRHEFQTRYKMKVERTYLNRSLKILAERGLVNRKKEVNLERRGMQYQYTITERGVLLWKSKERYFSY